MKKETFKYGDVVVRTLDSHNKMEEGDKDVVIRINEYGHQQGVTLEKFGVGHDPDRLRLATPDELKEWYKGLENYYEIY